MEKAHDRAPGYARILPWPAISNPSEVSGNYDTTRQKNTSWLTGHLVPNHKAEVSKIRLNLVISILHQYPNRSLGTLLSLGQRETKEKGKSTTSAPRLGLSQVYGLRVWQPCGRGEKRVLLLRRAMASLSLLRIFWRIGGVLHSSGLSL
jgi:hypothetical protein